MRAVKFSLILFLILGMVSCSSGKKSFQRGNYYDAVIKAVERLRSSPDNKKARQTLKDAYPYAVETLTTEIGNLLNSNEQFKYAGIVERYEKINSMADEIRRSPAARSLNLDIKDYSSQLSGAKEKAALESYQAADVLLEKGDRLSAREAFYLYENVNTYIPGYRDVDKKMDLARDLATLVVVVEEISVPGLYKINSDFFHNQIVTNLSDRLGNNFIEFVGPDEAGQFGHADHILKMQFDDFVVGATHDKEVIKNLTSKDSVKVGTANVEGKKVDVYDKVKATYTLHTREVNSSGILDVKIVDAITNKLVNNKKFPGQYVWGTDWSSYNGDKRALSAEQLKLTRQRPAAPPPPQELFLEFTKPIYDQTRSFLYNFYRQY